MNCSSLSKLTAMALSLPTIELVLLGLGLYVAFGYVLFFLTWVFFLASTNLKHAYGQSLLTNATTRWGKVCLVITLVLDALLNWLYISPALLHWTNRWLVTGHLEALMGRDDWRGRRARYFCRAWLDPFDGGCHCQPPRQA